MVSKRPLLARQLVSYSKLLYERNLVGGCEGNVSVRIDRKSILITPTSKSLRSLKTTDLVELSLSGKKLSGRQTPSSEYRLHLDIYQNRRDIGAVCHAHPLYATAFAVAGLAMEEPILPEIIVTFGAVPLIEYGTPGTDEIFEQMRDKIDRHDAFLLKNHGVVTIGQTLDEAFNRMEMVERSAQILAGARQLGTPWVLPGDLVEKLPGIQRAKA